MTDTITLPLWQFWGLLLFAAITFASHFLFPSVRWFFRRRMERVVARLNDRLERPIEPFKLAQRHDTIQKLIYDTEVSQAIADYARSEGMPENVAFERARGYAREIVPGFSATAYFGFAMRLARWLTQAMYRVRIQHLDADGLASIDPEAAVIYVINHRSNMDYVLVTWLASDRTAMSYAVGEWARVWPLSGLIRSMGAYFIRRRSQNALYRKVLERYVQMATDAGVTQAVFPEGGLSLTGALQPPKHGLLKYIAENRDTSGREVVFVPVALNYDRVFEDRVLIAAAQAGNRRFPARIGVVARFILRQLWEKLTGRFHYHGYAAVSFGSPLALSDFQKQHGQQDVEGLADELMRRIGAEVPVLPVALVAHVLLREEPIGAEALRARVAEVAAAIPEARVHLPEGQMALITERGLAEMRRRAMIREEDDMIFVQDDDLARFYAASLAHLFPDEG